MTAKPTKVSTARMASESTSTYQVTHQEAWREKLKDTPEQQFVVAPLVEYLCSIGWSQNQMVFGRAEWRVPKSPSELTKREKNQSYAGFPVDIAVFDDVKHLGDPRHLLFIIECKQPNEGAGISQLEGYFVGEPHVKLGIWANHPHPSVPSTFIYRNSDGSMLLKRRAIADLPRPGEAIQPEAQRTTFSDLIPPPEHIFRKPVQDLLDKVVINDSNVTRREEQLDQLCNLLLLKLESDKQGKSNQSAPVVFRTMENSDRTAQAIRDRFKSFVALYPDTFTTEQDKTLRLSNETIASCVEALSGLRLIDLGVSTVSVAFQVLRSEALKQGEGQFFTPRPLSRLVCALCRSNGKTSYSIPRAEQEAFL